MKTIHIQGKTGSSALLIGEHLNNLHSLISGRQTVIITDDTVLKLYEKDFPDCPVIAIGCGETIKTLDTVNQIYRRLIDDEADRSTLIVGIGGGIVCDITGFVASTYMRGLRFGFVASTLLAQVDASVGGKNGVNFEGFKNMVGVFNQPEFVICDIDMLGTLSMTDRLCGFAEIVKHAVIADVEMFVYLEKNWSQALALDREAIEKLVYDSIVIKAGVVNRDETEKGERRILNFGHTIGHAIEKTTGVPHGEAVGIGMVAASHIAVRCGLLSESDATRITSLLSHLHLPTRCEGRREEILSAMKKDKKREGSSIQFVLPQGIGRAIVRPLTWEQIADLSQELI
jgi:3-dehydroquinate synthase